MTTIESKLSPRDAFDYLADFSNARSWDPSVSKADEGGRTSIVAIRSGRSRSKSTASARKHSFAARPRSSRELSVSDGVVVVA